MAKMLSPIGDFFLRGKLAAYRSIEASDVAKAIVRLTGQAKAGIFVHGTPDLEKLAAD
jgi:hypothetical protein